MNIKLNGNCAFSDAIRQFIISTFPAAAGTISRNDLIDLLTTLTLGNSKMRQGPNPKPEVVVAIRDVIREVVLDNKPIPFMVPWGSVKPDGTSVDAAELVTLKMFEQLHKSVQEIYRPGIQVSIRLEDVSMPYFTGLDGDSVAAARYTRDFKALVKILGLSDFIVVRAESDLVTAEVFSEKADAVRPSMWSALHHYEIGQPDKAEVILNHANWKGGVPYEMREHYYGLYANLHPGQSKDFYIKLLGRYFASAVARGALKLRGDLPEWDGRFIDFALAQPVPGVPEGLFNRRVYRRAVSLSMSGRHVAPWRAKGFLAINDRNEACIKLRSYREAPDDLNEETVTLQSDCGAETVDVRVDWHVVD